jgi:electron transport complex protein RnfG
MRTTLKLAFVLFLVCAVAAGSLGFVNSVTRDRIAALELEAQKAARARVFPQADDFAEIEPGKVWTALKGGVTIGTVHRARIQGYSGIIDLMFGEDTEGALTAVRILAQTETAGLGAKIVAEKFLGQYAGKKAAGVVLKKDDPANGQIDAIAAATISSRAVTKAIRGAMTVAGGK